MTPDQFKSWRTDLGWTKVVAADRLGISVSQMSCYETGLTRHLVPKPVVIPKTVELACAALALGIKDYPGKYGLDWWLSVTPQMEVVDAGASRHP